MGHPVKVRLLRAGEVRELTVTIGTRGPRGGGRP